MEEKKETPAENADSKLNESVVSNQEVAETTITPVDALVNENEFANGESSYVMDVVAETPHEEEHIAEIHEVDDSKWKNYNLDEIKAEALNVIQQGSDLMLVGQALKKLRELHNAQMVIERQKLTELSEEDQENHEHKDLLDKKTGEFNAIWGIYQEKRKEHFDNIVKQQEENFGKKLVLLDDLKKLIEEGEPLKNTFDEFKRIQDKWREIGMVPKDKSNDLWLNYNHHVQMFLDKVKLNRELRDLDMKKNMEIKVELCEKAEELFFEKSLHESFKKLQELHHKWKETGPVPSDVKDQIWDRFRNASEKIREIRISHYDELNKKFEANLEAKTALVDKARNIASAEINTMKEWNASTKEMNELFGLWRSIGPAPKENNDKIWADFKGILDAFYAARKEYFNAIRSELNENYNKKLNICLEAEAIRESTDWKKTSNDLIRLQNEWRKVGPVPKVKSDVIWKRFRSACDDFFNRKKNYFENLSTVEAENLQKKLDLIKELEESNFTEDNKENLNLINEFQRRWFEIGRVPIEKKDEIQNEWHKKIDQTLDKLKISRFESENTRYKERMESVSKMNDGRDKMWTEVKKLRFNLSKLEQDVQLWENNLGFFANSKNAEVLLKEFRDKIERAKTDIKVMKEKEKYLQGLMNEGKK
ncbi:MAG: hypothetical protein A2W93_01265 [Bacteroidetes bacterium GWF2_43_63]|nr:MAG: hypothetical protein A2W93_01265 [Bacteroidetes bacterium GWF2_43_63]HCB61347.1 hypothetical protein [Bacteroidales bacterium]HCY24222.1 hypothetical protein [Bacteroidales bacterium]